MAKYKRSEQVYIIATGEAGVINLIPPSAASIPAPKGKELVFVQLQREGKLVSHLFHFDELSKNPINVTKILKELGKMRSRCYNKSCRIAELEAEIRRMNAEISRIPAFFRTQCHQPTVDNSGVPPKCPPAPPKRI